MKTARLSLLFILPIAGLLMFSSCERDNWHNIRGMGPVVSETRDTPDFRNISVSIPAEVYIYQNPQRELTIEAQSNILEAIKTRVNNEELNIGLENGAGLGLHETIRIYLSSAFYNSIRLSGSTNIYAETPVITDVFDVDISGSGTLEAEVVADLIRVSISGSGKTWLSGSTEAELYNISGSGDIYSYSLLCSTSDIQISGSGNAQVAVDDYLKARISGSGSIYYRGAPFVDSHISGSGKIVHVN